MKFRTAISFAALLSLLLSCEGSAPSLFQYRWQLVYRADTEGNLLHQELAVFAHGEDQDGQADLDVLQLEHPESQLTWEQNRSQWQVHELPGETWYALAPLVMPRGGDFPTGEYRLSLWDSSGLMEEQSWIMEEPSSLAEDFQPPKLERLDGELMIIDSQERPWMLLFFQNQQLIHSQFINSNVPWPFTGDLLDQDYSLYILYVDPQTQEGWKQGPYEKPAEDM